MARRFRTLGSAAIRRWGAAIVVLGLVWPVSADDAAPAETRLQPWLAAGAWAIAQLVPNPLLVVGDGHVGGGLRWQLTPLLFSFGIAERPVRSFFVSPIARHSGSVDLHVSPEWSCCAAGGDHSWLARAGLRVYLPLIEHGEVLSWSVGASCYYAADGVGPAGDLGIYTLFGVLGLTVTVSPLLSQREVIAALNIRYF
jgi:hypothetical protein